MKLASLEIESSALDLQALAGRGLLTGSEASQSAPKCFRPSTVQKVAEVVSAAAAERAPLLVCGGGTRMHWANPADSFVAGLSLEGLAGVIEFEPDEGVVRTLAGTRIATLQEHVAAEGWELPLDPPNALSSTVGGTISSAATGPRAHGFGRVADAILGLDLVGADGVPSKCGGRVVKNVTGYDMAKLYCGAFGTLGVITGAWLRLHPKPAKMKTLEAELPSTEEMFELCSRLAKQPSVRAFVWEEAAADGRARVVIEWGGSAEGVDHDHAGAAAALGGDRVTRSYEGDRGVMDRVRDARAAGARDDEVVLRARVLRTYAFSLLRVMRAAGLSVSLDVGLGAIHARGRIGSAEALLGLRRKVESDGSGSLLCESMPASWRGDVDAFGAAGDAASMMAILKKRFDPVGLLNPGRFVVGDSSLEL